MVDWTAENDRKLLLCIIRSCDVKIDLERVTAMFNEESDAQATKKAIRLHYAKLRKDDKEGDSAKSGPSTPGGNGKATNDTTKKTPGGGGRGRKKAPETTDADETPPAKRQKTTGDAKKNATKAKTKGKDAAKDTTTTDNEALQADDVDEDVKKEASDDEDEKAANMAKLDAELLALGSD